MVEIIGDRLGRVESRFKRIIKTSHHYYFAGLFKLSGTGGLIDLWAEISWFLTTEGQIVVVEKGKNGDLVLARVKNKIERDLLGNIVNIEVQYFDEKQTTERNPRKFVVFLNNINGTPDMGETDWVIDRLQVI